MSLRMKWLIVTSLALASNPAWAYLDPSTGSMVISAIVGLFASIALAMKTYWYKIKTFFRGAEETSKPLPGSTPEDPGA